MNHMEYLHDAARADIIRAIRPTIFGYFDRLESLDLDENFSIHGCSALFHISAVAGVEKTNMDLSINGKLDLLHPGEVEVTDVAVRYDGKWVQIAPMRA